MLLTLCACDAHTDRVSDATLYICYFSRSKCPPQYDRLSQEQLRFLSLLMI